MSIILLRVCQRCSAIGKIPPQAACQTWNMMTVWKRSIFYKKQFIWDRAKVFEFLYNDHTWFSFKGLDRYLKKRDEQKVIENQRYKSGIFENIGPDKWVANFVLLYKGKVKLRNDVVWLSERISLKNMQTIEVEGIDASGMVLYQEGLENLRYLDHLRYIKFGSYISDWYLFHLQTFKDGLEFVDVSGCTKVTEAGIASLSCLKKMKCLDLTGCTNIKHHEALAVHLETLLPELVILGLETLPKSEGNLIEEELKTSRFLNMGEVAELLTDRTLNNVDTVESLYIKADDFSETETDTTHRVVTH